MRKQNRFDLLREDGIAASQDSFPLPADDADVAFGRNGGEIAGLKPTLFEHRTCLIRVAEVTIHGGRGLDQEFAAVSASRLAIVRDAYLYARDRFPHCIVDVSRIAGEVGYWT